ncbi:MAG TPA: hypothetical protein VFS44_13250 [Gemmatimonadaceae bacterium]|nr:hypothetical protein [Gemmatimonadaceae bacterium]
MTGTTIAARMLIRITGTLLIILGIVLWTGHGRGLLSLHMLLGVVLVFALWVLAGLGAAAGVSRATVLLALVWGIVVITLGMLQTRLLPGRAHWVIQVLHLLVGFGAIGLGEGLAGRIQRMRPAAIQ